MTDQDDSLEPITLLVRDSRRHLDILTAHLTSNLFADPSLTSALTALARRGRQTRIRILVNALEPGRVDHLPLVGLCRRLSSAITLRELPNHPEWSGETVVLGDGRLGLISSTSDLQLRELESPAGARQWQERFERLWLVARESPELRQLL